jgi:phosphatidylglycerophosphate synthase
MRLIEVAHEIRDARTAGDFYTRLISRKVSHYFSALFIALGIRPNAITASMFFLGSVGAALLVPTSFVMNLAGALLFPILHVMDTSDGEVARYTQRFSDRGIFLDKIGPSVANYLLFSALGLRLMRQTGHWEWVAVGTIALIANATDDLIKESFTGLKVSSGDLERKEAKRALAYAAVPTRLGVLVFLVHVTGSVVALYHFLPLLIAFEWVEPRITQLFFAYFALASLVRVAERFRRAYRSLQ